MLTTRWQPYSELWNGLQQFRNRMNELLTPYAEENWTQATQAYPPLNVWQDEENIYAEAELPGMRLEDLEIYVTGGNQLSIKGERKQPEYEKAVWHRVERGFGRFGRLITLPSPVDADNIEAKFCHGILTIAMPKSESARPRKIKVKAE